jgi:hypothetical protein
VGVNCVVRNHSSSKVTIHALLLLVSLSFFMFFSSLFFYPSYPYDAYSYTYSSPSSLNVILSEEIPVFRYNATPYSVWMEITDLQTNETSVTLAVLDDSGTLLNVTNVTSISGFSIIVAKEQSGDLWLQMARQESDATVNITLRCWAIVYILTSPIAPFFPWPILGLFVIVFLYLFYKLVRTKSIGFSGHTQWKTGRGPITIILLLILGVACFFPLTQGFLHRDFIPWYTPQVSHETYSFAMNNSSPSWSLELADVYPEAETSISFKIHDFSASVYPILVRVSGVPQQELILGAADNEERWWFSFTVQTNQSTTLTFQRIDADSELTFAVETSYSIYVARVDLLGPSLLAFIGCGFSVLAIWLGIQIDLGFRKERHREESYDTVPIQ